MKSWALPERRIRCNLAGSYNSQRAGGLEGARMDMVMMIEIFGYIGSALVVVSMLMSSIVKLRVINTIGSVISGIYAVICGAIPLALMNTCLIMINVYNLIKLLKTEQDYDLVEGGGEDPLVRFVLEHYEKDIRLYFPGFETKDAGEKQTYIVCCGANPAGMIVGEVKDGNLDIMIDYSVPAYRDCSVGAYLYSKLAEGEVHTLRYRGSLSDAHVSYMKKMGFVEEQGAYVKRLK